MHHMYVGLRSKAQLQTTRERYNMVINQTLIDSPIEI